MLVYCLICEEAVSEGEGELCQHCQDTIDKGYVEAERVDQEIGRRSHAKVAEGFRLLKGQGE